MGRRRAGDVSARLRRTVLVVAVAVVATMFWATAAASAGTLFSKLPGEMLEGFYAPSAALLPNGEVLIAGGWQRGNIAVKTAELFNPASGAFESLAAEMAFPRGEMPAVSLPGGKVLVVGGYNNPEKALKSAELFNPSAGKFESAGEMTVARDGPGAALLPDGKVLIVGGVDKAGVYQKGADLYDPATNKFQALAAEANFGRYQPGVVPLPNGKVLILGGSVEGTVHNEYVATAELFNPATSTFEALEGAGHEPTERRAEMAAVTMQDGLALIAGGFNEITKTLTSEETFDYRTNTFEKLSNVLTEPRDGPAGVTLADGRVLIVAGAPKSGPYLSTAELSAVAPPAPSTTPASTIGQTAATLNGTTATEAVGDDYFQYGTTTAYGTSTPKRPLGGSLSPQLDSALIAALAPGTTYHYRLVAENFGGTSYGTDQTFTTASFPSPPVPAPLVSGVGETNHTWREGRQLARVSRTHRQPVGTVFKLNLNEPATIRLAFTQQLPGRKQGHRCVSQTHSNRHHHACKRTLLRGTLTLTGKAGLNKISFDGLLTRTRKLPTGSYTVTITASNASGHSSPQRLAFTIVR